MPSTNHSDKVTVIDLCSGVGYLSIITSELLHDLYGGAEQSPVCRFVLVDRAFPMLNNTDTIKSHHINPSHLTTKGKPWF